MTHWKLTLAYDGNPYHGWQVQPGLPSVQGRLADAIQHAIGERVLPQGSGRTDTGVHALGQVASFTLAAPIPPDRLQLALNRCLPASIRVLSAEPAPPTFHARHSALRKTYEYRIFPLRAPPHPTVPAKPATSPPSRLPDTVCPPMLAPYVWACPWPLSLPRLNEAAAHIVGTHDFTSFAASDPDLTSRNLAHSPATTEPAGAILQEAAIPPPPIRTITESHWSLRDALFIYRVTGTGFLHHMVRNLVGTFVDCGAARRNASSIAQLLAARDRCSSGPTAPASGLFLLSVEYPPTDLAGVPAA